MTKEEIECLAQMYGYLSFADERATLYANGYPVSTFDPISPMICQSNQIAYDMAELANANFSAQHTEQAARMDDICNHFATPYNESAKEPRVTANAKREGSNIEDLQFEEDLVNLLGIMTYAYFVWGVVIPLGVVWFICDQCLPFF